MTEVKDASIVYSLNPLKRRRGHSNRIGGALLRLPANGIEGPLFGPYKPIKHLIVLLCELVLTNTLKCSYWSNFIVSNVHTHAYLAKEVKQNAFTSHQANSVSHNWGRGEWNGFVGSAVCKSRLFNRGTGYHLFR